MSKQDCLTLTLEIDGVQYMRRYGIDVLYRPGGWDAIVRACMDTVEGQSKDIKSEPWYPR